MTSKSWLLCAAGVGAFLLKAMASCAAEGGATLNASLCDPAWGKAQLALRREIASWIKSAIQRQAAIPYQGGHDEVNYTAPWAFYYRLTGEPQPIEFMHTLRDQLMAWPKFHHGFYADPTMDIEHSFENWTQFMSILASVEPQDEKTLAALEDVVHHLGNWVPGIPEWYDWKAHRFTSEYLGTRSVRNFPPYDATTYWDARAVELALTFHQLKGDRKYLDWAADCGGGWAQAMVDAQDPRPGWFFPIPVSNREEIKRRYGAYPEDYEPRVKGWLPEIGSLFVHLYELTKDPKFAKATLKVIAEAKSSLTLKKSYQEATGDLRFKADLDAVQAEDRTFLERASTLLDEPLPTVLLLEGDTTYPAREYAYRTQSGELKESQTSPGEFWRAFELTGDARFAARAFDRAAVELRMACRTLRDGREHGCNGRFIHGAGGTAVSRLCAAAGSTAVEYAVPPGARGLPPNVAALCRVSKDKPNERRICLYNDGGKDQALRIRLSKDQPPIQSAVGEDGRSLLKDGSVELTLAGGKVTVVVIGN